MAASACLRSVSASLQVERISKGVPDSIGHDGRGSNVRDVHRADRELIASEATRHQRRRRLVRARQRVSGTKAVGEPVCHALENLVSEPMAKGVVDFFESIEIEKDDPKEPTVLLGLAQALLQLGSERHPVGQASQNVIVGEFQQLVRVSFGPQHVFDTFAEHPPIHRLGVEVRCPDVVGAGHGLCILGSGEHQDRDVSTAGALAQSRTRVVSAKDRHADIQQDEVRDLIDKYAARLLAILGDGHGVPVLLERRLRQESKDGVIVGHEHKPTRVSVLLGSR